MDVFSRTGTHGTILQRCLEPGDEPVLVARLGRGFLLLTRRRMVVTSRTALGRKVLHLNATLGQLSNVSWSMDAREQRLEVSLTAVDGVREHFVLRMADAAQAHEAEELFRSVMQPRREDFAAAA